MTSARTEAVIGAALADPSLIEAWQAGRRRRPDALGDVDLDTLRRFGGLGYKVRHNGLRRHLPASFRLMRMIQAELDLFAAYAAARSRDRAALAPNDAGRMRDLVAFIGHWRQPEVRAHDLLWDMIRHESALAELGMAAPRGIEAIMGDPTPDSRLAVNGLLIRHDLIYEPAEIAAARSVEALDLLTARTASVGYWRRPQSERIERLNLDAFSAAILDLIDGRTSLDAISRGLLGCPASPVFLAMAGELVTIGVAADARDGP